SKQNIMKKSNSQPKKLTKKELKKISGGARPICPLVVSCFDPSTGQEFYGVYGIQDGPCC
ncbi:MAG: bacteriocin, partial [Chryseobacterium sp.]|nr:bacteriocin [Chryseobacterium sp.]